MPEQQPRKLTSHQVNPCNEALEIEVLDQPGAGGAPHLYRVKGFSTASNPSDPYAEWYGEPAEECTLLFQNGAIPENGVNGITQEVLIAICIDRLERFQAGPFACRENALALTKLQEAQHWLHHRTRTREARGVEGTHER